MPCLVLDTSRATRSDSEQGTEGPGSDRAMRHEQSGAIDQVLQRVGIDRLDQVMIETRLRGRRRSFSWP